IQHNGDTAFVYLLKPGSGTPAGGTQTTGAPQSGNENPNSSTSQANNPQGKSGKASGNAGHGPAGGHESNNGPQYHAVMQVVKTGVTDNGNTAVQGIQPGDVVANSSFEKLQSGSTVYLTKANFPSSQEVISSESSAP